MLQPLQHPFYSTLLLSQPAMRLIRNMAMLMPLGVHAVRWLWRVVCAIKPTAVVTRLLSRFSAMGSMCLGVFWPSASMHMLQHAISALNVLVFAFAGSVFLPAFFQ
jgi:hypothetical protein